MAVPETAQSTRKLLTVALWLFAVGCRLPVLPGSDSEAFKGVSVFVGLVVSLGSSGIVNQVMSGFTLTYSRAFRSGDFVSVGDVEGTVTQVGTLSTKIKTAIGEDVTIPNGLVVSQTVINYSRFAETEGGVFVPTDITIGYDVPWRQVQALLLLAAARSQGARREPAPVVRLASLEDAYIRYTLQFCLENPKQRGRHSRPCTRISSMRSRVWGADHIAQLRGRSRNAQDRAARSLVSGACHARHARRKTHYFFGG